jgi:predicted DNA-binding protein (MmcQ/YjbR family)
MNIEEYYQLCTSWPFVQESFPFDENTLVFKVKGKAFALTDISLFESFNVKCEPELALELREKYDSVLPGYHMNKKHWNTIIINGAIADKMLKQWLLDSYKLVVKGLPKKDQFNTETLTV